MNTLQNNVTDSFYTKFYPSLQSFTGSAISTLIIGKLEYWFSNPKFMDGFYKFVEPCRHPLYREGDSWSEELGVSRKLFAKAFDVIGIRYNSKSAYLRADDKFQGKLYASYHDRKTNRTYFVRNHEFTSQLLERLFKKKKPELQQKKTTGEKNETPLKKIVLKSGPHKDSHLEKTPLNSASSDLSQGRSRNGDLGRSYARVSSIQKKTSSSLEIQQKISLQTLEPVDRSLTEEMIKIWKEEVGELGISSPSNGLLTRLQTSFREFFEGSIESWKDYCQMISSSKFLMGEAQNKFFKKAWIIWAIKGENIERVKSGDFKLGDRKTNQDHKIESIDREIQQVEYKKHQIEMKISNIKENERDKRSNIVKEKIKNISEQERLAFEKEFETFLEKENNSMTEEFRKSRWNGMFISVYFDSFVKEKIYSQLFGNLDENHDEQIVRSSGLLEVLDDVSRELAQIKQKKRNVELQ